MGVAQLVAIWAMLDRCAPGARRDQRGDHYWSIVWGDQVYPRLPLGRHGRGRRNLRAEMELGHVRQLIRQFGIEACVRQHFPHLLP